jgi:hypothetical protein
LQTCKRQGGACTSHRTAVATCDLCGDVLDVVHRCAIGGMQCIYAKIQPALHSMAMPACLKARQAGTQHLPPDTCQWRKVWPHDNQQPCLHDPTSEFSVACYACSCGLWLPSSKVMGELGNTTVRLRFQALQPSTSGMSRTCVAAHSCRAQHCSCTGKAI